MTDAIKFEPRLVVQVRDDSQEDAQWVDNLDYHIASDNESQNNRYVGAIVDHMRNSVHDNQKRYSWRIVYREKKTLRTTKGSMNLPGMELVVSQENKRGVNIEEFVDRNGDDSLELNVGIPYYEQFPRFKTEHDEALIAASAPAEEDEDEGKKEDSEAKAGEEVEGEDPIDETVHVKDGDVLTVYDELGHKQTIQISVI